jgi:hypothetical protein
VRITELKPGQRCLIPRKAIRHADVIGVPPGDPVSVEVGQNNDHGEVTVKALQPRYGTTNLFWWQARDTEVTQ